MKQRDEVREKFSEKNFIEARYANYFEIGHNSVEFIFNFGQSYDSDEGSSVHTRIITSPIYAKDLLDTLQRTFAEYKEACVEEEDSSRTHRRYADESDPVQKRTPKPAYQR